MERGYRDIGRASLGRPGFDDYGSYGRSERGGYDDYEQLTRDSYLGSAGRSYRSERSSYGAESSGYDRERVDILDSLLQQRALQQQLSLRESQLALANSLLQQQQQQQFLTKRRMDPRGGDLRRDFKRPRLMDDRFRPRNQLSGGQDSYGRRRDSRGGSSNWRNQRSSPRASQGQLSSDRSKNKDKNDPKKSAADGDDEGSKLQCKPCGLQCKDEEELKKHKDTTEHKEKMKKPYCHICDIVINNVDLPKHQRNPFHKKRQIQVVRGCTWCDVASFKNFTEVLEHRATDQHVKNQEKYDKRGSDSRRDSHGEGRSRREREPIKVHLPPELDKFDPKVVVGQSCVVDVTGWFCKLCNKFYNNETAAKETHCMTEPHFKNYKKFMYTKLRAKAEAERDAREKAAEEERKKKEAEEKEAKGEEEEPSSEQVEGDHKETTDGEGEEQEGGDEVEENGMAEGEEAGVEREEAGAEGEETGMKGEESFAEEEEAAMDEEEGEEMIGEPEEYVDDEEAAAAEKEGLLETPEGGEDLTGTEDVENVESAVQEEVPQAVEEPMEAEVEEEGAKEEEEAAQKKATRATVSSPARGRGRGGSPGRARRGRRVAK